MSAPAIIWLAIVAISLLINARDHGKPKTGKDSFWVALLSVSIGLALLYWGGFFAKVAA